jgi:hypothetical protein
MIHFFVLKFANLTAVGNSVFIFDQYTLEYIMYRNVSLIMGTFISLLLLVASSFSIKHLKKVW